MGESERLIVRKDAEVGILRHIKQLESLEKREAEVNIQGGGGEGGGEDNDVDGHIAC